VFKGDVPAGVKSLIYAAVPGLLAFAAAYLAPHQHRDPAPVPGQPVPAEQSAADERVVPPVP
jgi:hypothetical protein